MQTAQATIGIEEQKLNELRKYMGNHSNDIISDILQFTQESNPETKNQIIKEIKDNVTIFLDQKTAISSEYISGDENGEAYHFENREKYRQNIVKLIGSILENPINEDVLEKVKEVKNKLIRVLENDGR